MSYGISSNSGYSCCRYRLSRRKKNIPVYGEELNVDFLINSLPDFYRNFLQGTRIPSSIWSGAAQVTSDLLNLYQTDYAKSLRDIPTYSQRKWVKLKLENTVDFGVDPSFTSDGIGNNFQYSAANNNLAATFVMNPEQPDRYYKSLNGTVNEVSSLLWSYDITISSATADAVAFAGYLKKDSKDLTGSFLAGIVKLSAGVRVCLAHTPTKDIAATCIYGATSSLRQSRIL